MTIDFNDVRRQVELEAANKSDTNVKVGRLTYVGERGLYLDQPNDEFYSMNDWAFQQFCGKLGIPTRYMDSCPLWLQEQNATYWLDQRKNDTWLIRTDGNVVRAVLSDSYVPIDNTDLMNELNNVDWEQLGIQGFWTTDKKLMLRTTLEDLYVEVDGKPVFAGLDIQNSEVGAHSLSVGLSFWQLVCRNGMIHSYGKGEFYRKVHRGGEWGIENRFDAILNSARELSVGVLEKIRRSAMTRKEIDEMVAVALQLGLQKSMVEAVKARTDTTMTGGARVYDFVSAITRQAQEYTLETRNEMETIGMRMLERMVA